MTNDSVSLESTLDPLVKEFKNFLVPSISSPVTNINSIRWAQMIDIYNIRHSAHLQLFYDDYPIVRHKFANKDFPSLFIPTAAIYNNFKSILTTYTTYFSTNNLQDAPPEKLLNVLKSIAISYNEATNEFITLIISTHENYLLLFLKNPSYVHPVFQMTLIEFISLLTFKNHYIIFYSDKPVLRFSNKKPLVDYIEDVFIKNNVLPSISFQISRFILNSLENDSSVFKSPQNNVLKSYNLKGYPAILVPGELFHLLHTIDLYSSLTFSEKADLLIKDNNFLIDFLSSLDFSAILKHIDNFKNILEIQEQINASYTDNNLVSSWRF